MGHQRGGAGGGGEERLGDRSDRPLRGGVVQRSGLAYVHAGETIHARPGAEAEIQLLSDDLGADIHITLPVIVHITAGTGIGDEARADEIAELALRRLREAIEAQGLG